MPVDLCAALTIVQVVLRLRPRTRAWSSSETMPAAASAWANSRILADWLAFIVANGLPGCVGNLTSGAGAGMR